MFYDNCVDYEFSVNAQRHKNRRKTSIHLGTYNNTIHAVKAYIYGPDSLNKELVLMLN